MKYVIEKEAIYLHGVFWIGDDLEVGKEKLLKIANADWDDYHEWCLKEFIPDLNPKGDAEHKKLYRAWKSSTEISRYES